MNRMEMSAASRKFKLWSVFRTLAFCLQAVTAIGLAASSFSAAINDDPCYVVGFVALAICFTATEFLKRLANGYYAKWYLVLYGRADE